MVRWKGCEERCGLGAQCGALKSTCQHNTPWKPDRNLVKPKKAELRALVYESTQYLMVVRSKAFEESGRGLELREEPSVSCQHSITWWSDRKPVRKEAGLRAQGGTLCIHLSTQYHMVVRSKACEEKAELRTRVNTVPHSG